MTRHSSRLCPGGTPRAGVKSGWLPVDVVDAWCQLSPDSSLTVGAAAGALHCCLEHASPPVLLPVGSPGNRSACDHDEVAVIDIEETEEAVDLVERVCALDIGKAAVTVCSRVPHDDKPGTAARKSGSTLGPPGRCWTWPTGCTPLA